MRSLILLLSLAITGCVHTGTHTESQAQPTETVAPPSLEDVRSSNVAMSRAIATEILRRMPLAADARGLTYMNTLGQYVAQELVPSLKCQTDGTQASAVRIAVVKSAQGSAFSLPGGLIFITTSFLQTLASEDELAGVIASEMVLSICQKGVPNTLASEAASGWSGFISTLPTRALDLPDLKFADRYALVTLYRRGYDLTPYVQFVKQKEISGRRSYGPERAALLQKSVAATPPISSTAAARVSRFKLAKSKLL